MIGSSALFSELARFIGLENRCIGRHSSPNYCRERESAAGPSCRNRERRSEIFIQQVFFIIIMNQQDPWNHLGVRWTLAIALIMAVCATVNAEKVLHIPLRSDDPKSLDPVKGSTVYDNRANSMVYETLLQYKYLKRPAQLEPLLLTEMPEISADGLTYGFRLKKASAITTTPVFREVRDANSWPTMCFTPGSAWRTTEIFRKAGGYSKARSRDWMLTEAHKTRPPIRAGHLITMRQWKDSLKSVITNSRSHYNGQSGVSCGFWRCSRLQ